MVNDRISSLLLTQPFEFCAHTQEAGLNGILVIPDFVTIIGNHAYYASHNHRFGHVCTRLPKAHVRIVLIVLIGSSERGERTVAVTTAPPTGAAGGIALNTRLYSPYVTLATMCSL